MKPRVLDDSAEESKLIFTADAIFMLFVNMVIGQFEKSPAFYTFPVLLSIASVNVAQTTLPHDTVQAGLLFLPQKRVDV